MLSYIHQHSAGHRLAATIVTRGFSSSSLRLAKPLSHYEHLGLTPTATRSEIKSQYYALSKKLHPDTNPGDEAAHNQFIRITEAYDILYDDVQRKEYDRTLGTTNNGSANGKVNGYGTRFSSSANHRRATSSYHAAKARAHRASGAGYHYRQNASPFMHNDSASGTGSSATADGGDPANGNFHYQWRFEQGFWRDQKLEELRRARMNAYNIGSDMGHVGVSGVGHGTTGADGKPHEPMRYAFSKLATISMPFGVAGFIVFGVPYMIHLVV